jgi:transposase
LSNEKEAKITAEIKAIESESSLENLKKVAIQKALEVDYLQTQLAFFKNRLFRRKLEKFIEENPSQDSFNFFDEVEAILQEEQTETRLEDLSETLVAGYVRKVRGKRRPLPANIEREVVTHEIPLELRKCEVHGSVLKEMGEDTSEAIKIIPEKITVLRTITKKYCCDECEGNVKKALVPATILPKSNCTAETLSYIITSKYDDHLPLYRIEERLARLGIDLPRQTMARWVIESAEKLQVILNLLKERVLGSTYIQMDETRVQVVNENLKTIDSEKYIWVMRAVKEKILIFEYNPSRSSKVPKELLQDYKGTIQTDGYGGYGFVDDDKNLIRLGCTAHVRRKFVEITKVKTLAGKSHTVSNRILSLYKKIYKIEEDIKAETKENRYKIRQTKSKLLLNEIEKIVLESIDQTSPNSALGKALGYAKNQWTRVMRYLDDGDYEIDNNSIERVIKAFATGRKNWLFSSTVDGANASALYFTLLETAKENGLNPNTYFTNLFHKIPEAKTLEDFEALLPLKK